MSSTPVTSDGAHRPARDPAGCDSTEAHYGSSEWESASYWHSRSATSKSPSRSSKQSGTPYALSAWLNQKPKEEPWSSFSLEGQEMGTTAGSGSSEKHGADRGISQETKQRK
ncbi:MAG: hypothetical protein Q9182_003234 [Xanthomendoza sp. 2 TL-2023]